MSFNSALKNVAKKVTLQMDCQWQCKVVKKNLGFKNSLILAKNCKWHKQISEPVFIVKDNYESLGMNCLRDNREMFYYQANLSELI